MNRDNPPAATTYYGKKTYRLMPAIARLKPRTQPKPNYWDENETVETIKPIQEYAKAK